jgi:hypothetical protein
MSEPHRLPDSSKPTLPAPAESSGTRPASMRERWAGLVSSTHSPRRWAVIAAAIRTADAASVDPFGAPVQRGDEAWCRVAITALESPAATQELPDVLASRCYADPDLLRAWLGAPAAYANHGRTIADGLNLVDWRTASHEAVHHAVANLVEQAQDAGVYGVAGFRVKAHRLVDTDDWHAGYLLVARPAFGPGLASDELVDDDIIPTHNHSIVDGAVRVLTNAATVVNAVLDRRDAAQPAPTPPAPGQTRGHAFRAGADRAGTADLNPPAVNPPTPPHSPRTR